jgi:large subunit ribosomal protein L21
MYAVIKTGGKQYKVAQGDILKVERLRADEGAKIDLTEVLMIADGDNVTIGKPCIAGASVSAQVKSQGRGPKVKIIKFKRRKHYQRQAGHRQAYTELAITGINTG